MPQELGASLGLNVTGFSKGAAAARKIADSLGSGLSAAFTNAGKAAEQAAAGAQKFAREQGQQASVVTRLTGELRAVAPMSREAAAATQAFGGALYEVASGGLLTFGGALAAVGAAVATYKLLTAEASALIAKLDQEQEARSQRVAKAADDARRALILQGQTRFATPEQAEAALRVAESIGEAKTAAGLARADFEAATENLRKMQEAAGLDPIKRLALRFTSAKDEVDALSKKMAEANANLKALQEEADRAAKADLVKFQMQDPSQLSPLARFRGAGQAATAFITSGEVSSEDAEAKRAKEQAAAARRDSDAYAKAYRENYEREMAQLAKDLGQRGLLARYGGVETAPKQMSDAQYAGTLQQYSGALTGGQGMGRAATAGLSDEQMKRSQKALEDHKKRVEDLKKSYQKLTDSAVQGLADLITQHRKAGDIAKDLARQGLQVMAQYAIDRIMNAASVAGANAAASSAEAGPPGILAAPGAMAAMISMVAALAGNIISAEGGADFSNIPLGRPFYMVGHGGEQMIPAPIAAWVTKAAKRDAEGGGMAGDGLVLNFNGPGWDARAIRQLVVNRDFSRALRESARKGV